jgi:hypothetical protein
MALPVASSRNRVLFRKCVRLRLCQIANALIEIRRNPVFWVYYLRIRKFIEASLMSLFLQVVRKVRKIAKLDHIRETPINRMNGIRSDNI